MIFLLNILAYPIDILYGYKINLLLLLLAEVFKLSIFDDYYYWKQKLESYSFYNYIKIISCIKYNIR